MKTAFFLIALSLGAITCTSAGARADSAAAAVAAAPSPLPGQVLPDFTALVRQAGPAVVNIRVFRIQPAAPAEQSAPPALPPTQPPRAMASGSGFLVSPNGVILTNSHVVAGASKVTVRLSDKRELAARVIGVDELTDVAVLKIAADDLPSVQLGDSAQIAVGQWVLAIGAPFGLERTATQGIISALGRALPNDSYVPFIQTDVPINPGNSGGPLFDLSGRVIGINSQIVSTSGGYMGLSFAIPINTALEVAAQILKHGRATHGWLGASAQDLTQELARAYGLDSLRGALLNEISPASPAQQAGLQAGDIILAFDDIAIADSSDLPPLIGASRPGEKRRLTLLRDGQIVKIGVLIGELGAAGAEKRRSTKISLIPRLGLQASDLDDATRLRLELQAGVLVEDVEPGPAALAGVLPGDIVLKIGRQTIHNVAQLGEAVAALDADQPTPVLVKRQDSMAFLAITLAPGLEPRGAQRGGR